MNKSNKQRTLKAIRELIDKYENPDIKYKYFNIRICPLCKIYNSVYNTILQDIHCKEKCLGCRSPKSKIKDTYSQAFWPYISTHGLTKGISNEVKIAFLQRAMYFRKVYFKIWDFPKKKFTDKGWKKSEERMFFIENLQRQANEEALAIFENYSLDIITGLRKKMDSQMNHYELILYGKVL